jgi:hypothetical protein
MKIQGTRKAQCVRDFAKRAMTALSMLLVWMAPAAGADTESDVVAALTELKSHVLGLDTLDGSAISTHKATIVSGSSLFASSTNVISAAFDLVNSYDAEVGALWADGSPIQSFDRDTVTDEEIGWVVYSVMQTLMDETYTVDNIAANAALLAGKLFGSSAHFPGAVAAPTVVTNTATINASYPDTAGWPRSGDTTAARKPTGNYVAPGTIVTVSVPSAIVGKGYQIRVGAHSWDLETRKSTVKRLDRSSMIYDIDRTEIEVGSPLGGGIYIEVPYLADEGVVEIEITGAVRSPYYSSNNVTGHMTSLTEWQETERNHPAPWADFQTGKFMMQVPTDWIYKWDDPVSVMAEWDHAMDTMNDLMGFPHERGKETMYIQVDVIMRGDAYFPGYPTANTTYNPDTDYGGLKLNHFTQGPQSAPYWLFHEQGHAYLFKKFDGETESNVNLPHVAIWNNGFGIDLDTSFRSSLGYAGNADRTVDNTAVAWMLCPNFVNGIEMAEKEKKYQLKGHAKFADVARMFGWQAVNDYYAGMVADDVDKDSTESEDQMIDRLSDAADVDIRPLLHFWGVHPGAGATGSLNHRESIEIYHLLMAYRGMIPADNAAFQTFALKWWDGEPSLDGFQTESEHAAQWDSYDADSCAAIQARLDAVIDLYFPNGEPVDDVTAPSPDPMTWVLAPAAYDSSTIVMEATVATDKSNPVEYYFENTVNGDTSGWITGTCWTNSGLTAGQTYGFRVCARDREGNTGSWSATATADPAEDGMAPSPSPMEWASVPAGLSSSAITMTATTATDPAGVEYYFSCTAGSGHDSGWQESPVYIDAGLGESTTCSYAVMARDKSANANQTAASASASATTHAVADVLFADTFDRADSTDLNATTDGKSGALGALNYTVQTYSDVTLDISGETLRINGPASDGSYGGLVYIDDHNFADAAIAAGGGFSIRVDIAAYSTLGSGRRMAVGVGQSLAELETQPGVDASDHRSDLLVAYRDTTDSLEIYKNGLLDSAETISGGLPNDPTTMRIEYTCTGFKAGSTVIYNVYFDDDSTAFTSGTFTWSGTAENYISLASNLSNDSLFDNLEIRGEDVYDDQTPPTPDPMSWATPPEAISNSEITMVASEAYDLSGVEYYFSCSTGGGHDSGWQDSPDYTDSGLTSGTTYAYTVAARDKSISQHTSGTSEEAAAATPAAPRYLYTDTFDNDGLDVNSGIGGGMSVYKANTRDFTWADDGNLDSSDNSLGNRYAAVYSDNAFSVTDGFVLDVIYNIDVIEAGSDAYSASFGLIASPTGIASSHFMANNGQTSIGVSLTDRLGVQGLNEINPATGLTSLADATAQPISTGTARSFSLQVEKDGSYSYSIDGQTPTTGTTLFDLSHDYHFAVFEQYQTGIELQRITLMALEPVVTEIGDIALSMESGSAGLGFNWYGESGQTYRLEVTEDLTSGIWQTITNVAGADDTISLTAGMDKTNAFYRVHLSE